jgi:hypothetical protein
VLSSGVVVTLARVGQFTLRSGATLPPDAEPRRLRSGVCAAGRHGRGGQPIFRVGRAVIGTLLSAFFGPAFGGALPRSVADYCIGPEDVSPDN